LETRRKTHSEELGEVHLMIRVTAKDFERLLKVLKKEGQEGALLTFRIEQTSLFVTTFDKLNKEMTIRLSDTDYPFMPTITKTETIL
jgi:hypothetical protein